MGQSPSYFVLGHRVTPLPTIGDYGLVEIITAPGVPGPPAHHHEDAAEFFYIADGCLDVEIDGHWQTMRTGQCACLPKGTVHTFRNPGPKECRWITGWSPRGFEEFFTRFGVSAEIPDACAKSTLPDVIARVVAECGDLGMVLAPAAVE